MWNRKPSQTQKYFEAEVIHKHDGKVDLKKLWAREDEELDPAKVEQYASLQNYKVHPSKDS